MNNIREYYGGVPEVIQVSQHCFISSDLLEFFATSKTFGWYVLSSLKLAGNFTHEYTRLSSMNCARIYNQSIGILHAEVTNNPLAHPGKLHRPLYALDFDWQTSLHLQDTDVLNGFFLFSLLLDRAEQKTILYFEHDAPSQKDRLKPALQERNVRMEGFGQEEYTHACDLCYIVFLDEDGRLGE